MNQDNLLLYVVTDRSWLGNNKLEDQVEEIIKSGATFIQLREKKLDINSFVNEAKKIKEVTDRYHIPFVINDNVEVALTVDADGVHVGQSDQDAKHVREIIGKDKILGVSVQTVQQALLAQNGGADYVGVGAIFSTDTKCDANTVSIDTLRAICNSVTIPVVAIGGIHADNMIRLKDSGIDGVSIISAIFAQPDISTATKELLQCAKEIFR